MSAAAETRVCKNCSSSFAISQTDAQFYQRVEVPFPTWCASCRHIRRHGHVNDYVYYSRTCDGCTRRFVSTFPQSSPYRVFCQTCWYSETRDDKAEGRAYDPNRSFMEQFDELMHAAPQMGIIAINTENSEYCESIADCKNTYLISECSHCEDCLYAYWIQKTRDCVDNCYLHECERCYETSDSFNCYSVKYSSNCQTCSDSAFLDNCIACNNCLFCVNLRHKEFHIWNQPVSKEEYQRATAELALGRRDSVPRHAAQYLSFLHSQPAKHLQILQAENSLGDYVQNAKNCRHVFHCYDAEDCSYGEHIWRGAKDCMDVNTAGRGAELIYEATNTNMGAYFSKFARYCWGCRYAEYSNMCVNGSYLFGCVGLKAGAKHCILNRSYSEADYFTTVEKIKNRMLKDGEYGEFFPLSISLFGYNNSVSFDDRGYSEAEVKKRGWKWETALSGTKGKGTISANAIPQSITETGDGILDEVLACSACERNYRIVKKELAFYRRENVPVPLTCPDCRHRARLARRRKKELRDAACSSCATIVQTALDPQLYRRICCEECYQRLVYT